MTREEVQAIPVGRELDAAVAERFMGYDWCQSPPPYSTEIAAAWTVVEKLRTRFTTLSIVSQNGWHVIAWDEGASRMPSNVICADGTDFPDVVCRAALLACLEGAWKTE